MEVSVVIPLYNKVQYILRAIESVLFQTYQYFEVIVIDDGSTDEGLNKVKRLEENKIRLFQQENKGVSAARNLGISLAKYDLIAFLDADDEWHAEFLEKIIELNTKFNNCACFATSYKLVYHNNIVAPFNFNTDTEFSLTPYDFFNYAGKWPLFTASSTVIKKEVFNRTGGFLDGKKVGEDLEMFARIALQYSFAFSTRSLVLYHRDTISNASNNFNYSDHIPFSYYLDFARKNISEEKIPYWINYWERQQIRLIKISIRDGYIRSTKYFGRDLRNRNYKTLFWKIISELPEFILLILRNMIIFYKSIANT